MTAKVVELGTHAKVQVRDRQISEILLTEAFNSPDLVIEQSKGRTQILKKFRQRNKQFVLVVIYKESQKKYYVVTAWYSSKIKKYFKTV